MNKNDKVLLLIGLLAIAGLAAMFYLPDLLGRAGMISMIRFKGTVDDANGKPIYLGNIAVYAGEPLQRVAWGEIKGAYWIHFQTTFEKNYNWYENNYAHVYVNGEYCQSIDIYALYSKKGILAEEYLELQCVFTPQISLSAARYR